MRAQNGLSRISEGACPHWFAGSFVILRVALGLQFLLAGWSKLTSEWTAAEYLATANGPFAEWFQSLSGSVLVDNLNIWGQILIGLALILGLAVRPAAIGGLIMMLLYYFAQFTENTAYGLIEDHLIYALVFLVFATGGAGHVFGLNAVVLNAVRKPRAIVRFLLS